VRNGDSAYQKHFVAVLGWPWPLGGPSSYTQVATFGPVFAASWTFPEHVPPLYRCLAHGVLVGANKSCATTDEHVICKRLLRTSCTPWFMKNYDG
jgi:hypothetical protein